MYTNGDITVEELTIAGMPSLSIKNAGDEISRLINIGNMTPQQMFTVVQNNVAKKLKIELDPSNWVAV